MLLQTWREFDRLVDHIETVLPGTDEYDKVLRQMNQIIHMQEQIYKRPDMQSRWDWFFKNQALVGGVFTLIGTGAVLYHERLDVITSRAFGWLRFK